MSDFEQSVNTPEVAEQVEDTSVNTEEVAEPQTEPQETGTEETGRDSAMARYRRENGDLSRQLKESQEQLAEFKRQQSLNSKEQEKASQLAEAERIGREQGLSEEEIADLVFDIEEDFDRQAEYDEQESEMERLQAENAKLQAERLMREDLAEIQKINPEITSIEELGDTFFKMRTLVDNEGNMALTAEQAYYASLAHDEKLESMKPKAPNEPGFDSTSAGDKAFYTQEEIENMSMADIKKIPEDVLKESMSKW